MKMGSKKILDTKNPSGPVKIGKLKVWVDRDLCISAGTCIAIAPHTYDLDTEGKAVILKSADKETRETIIDSAHGCPTAAIIIEDENGKRIYPKK